MSQKNQTWTDEEVQTLIHLLEKVKADGGWWRTEECMRAAHGTMSVWALELVIIKPFGILGLLRRIFYPMIGLPPASKILLTIYDGGIEEFRGRWHIPGGYGTIADESVRSACSRIAWEEIGGSVRFVRVYPHPYLWPPHDPGKHPYGRPLSLYTMVKPTHQIREGRSCRFFGHDELPTNLIEPHRKFIEQYIFPCRC